MLWFGGLIGGLGGRDGELIGSEAGEDDGAAVGVKAPSPSKAPSPRRANLFLAVTSVPLRLPRSSPDINFPIPLKPNPMNW